MFKRDTKNKMIGGVCAGLAKHTGMDAALVRIAAVISIFVTGSVTFWIYIILWILLPPEDKQDEV